jgi:hypothetical protein
MGGNPTDCPPELESLGHRLYFLNFECVGVTGRSIGCAPVLEHQNITPETLNSNKRGRDEKIYKDE